MRTVPGERRAVGGPSWSALWAGLHAPRRFLAELNGRIREARTVTSAAALAYYFFFAAFPFLLFLLALVTVLPVRGVDDWLLASLADAVPGEAYTLLDGTIRGLLAQPRGGLLSVGAILALWSASSACASLMDALNQAYRVSEGRPWWRVRLQAIALTLGLSLFLIVAFGLALFGAPLVMLVAHVFGPAAALVSMIVRWVIVIAFITLVITAVYYFGPDVEQRWRWVTPGSVLVTVGFGATSAGFSYYVSHFGSYNKTYGSLGAVIILLFWMYLFAVFLLLGGQVNALLDRAEGGAENRTGDET